MSKACPTMDRTRTGLWEVILGELGSWPELHRQIFVQSHYRGQSIEQVSRFCGLGASDVRSILQQCESRLRQALKAFRGSMQELDSSRGVQSPTIAPNSYIF